MLARNYCSGLEPDTKRVEQLQGLLLPSGPPFGTPHLGATPESWIAIGDRDFFSTMAKPRRQRSRLMQPSAVSAAISSGVGANSSRITSSNSSVGSTSCPFPRRSSATAWRTSSLPAGARQPSRHHCHIRKYGRRRRPRPDTRIGQCRHVPISPIAIAAAPLRQRLRSRPALLRLCAGPVSDAVDLPSRPVHRYVMEERGWIARHGFWPLALMWLPAGVVVQAAIRFLPETDAPPDPGMWTTAALMAGGSLLVVAPCGVPLALGCRRLWRLGYRRGAWWAGIALGALTVTTP